MLEAIPIDPSLAAILVGLAIVAVSVVVGVVLARRDVKRVNPHDPLRGP